MTKLSEKVIDEGLKISYDLLQLLGIITQRGGPVIKETIDMSVEALRLMTEQYLQDAKDLSDAKKKEAYARELARQNQEDLDNKQRKHAEQESEESKESYQIKGSGPSQGGSRTRRKRTRHKRTRNKRTNLP
jgi:hypothetical protein